MKIRLHLEQKNLDVVFFYKKANRFEERRKYGHDKRDSHRRRKTKSGI